MLSDYAVILGSSSPRRKYLLESLGLEFQTIAPVFTEKLREGEEPREYVMRNSGGKASCVYEQKKKTDPLNKESQKKIVIVGADTIVVHNNNILQKPKNKGEAWAMLRQLSGSSHRVLTGVSFLVADKNLEQQHLSTQVVVTNVLFKKLSDRELEKYISTGEPMDKAGSYGIQGAGAYMVKEIQGSYTNVMGLPMTEFYEFIQNLD